jgi:hypothetical protein
MRVETIKLFGGDGVKIIFTRTQTLSSFAALIYILQELLLHSGLYDAESMLDEFSENLKNYILEFDAVNLIDGELFYIEVFEKLLRISSSLVNMLDLTESDILYQGIKSLFEFESDSDHINELKKIFMEDVNDKTR